MSKNKLPFERLDGLLAQTLKGLGLEENFKVYPIWKQWSKIVGPEAATRTHPDFVRGSTLIVSVSNSVWMNELQLQTKLILGRIASLKLEHPIDDLRFRMMQEN